MANKVKAILSVLLSGSMVLAFAGCGGSAPSAKDSQKTNQTVSGASAAGSGSKKIVIGFSQCTLQSPFYVSIMDAAKAEAEAKGAEFIYADAQNGVQKQNSDIQDMISKGVDILLVNPVQSSGVQPAMAAAKSKNIPVVAVDRNIKEGYTSFVGRDNKVMGKLAGEKAVELLGGAGKAKGKILEVQGGAGDQVMMDRRDGFHSAVDKEPGIKVIQTAYCDYERSKAVTASQDAFQANKDIDLIYAHNDDMALGALQVAKQRGLDKIKVVGVDGLMEAVKQIAAGPNYQATALNDPGYEGKLAVDTAMDILSGKTAEKFIDAKTSLVDAGSAKDYVNDSLTFAALKIE